MISCLFKRSRGPRGDGGDAGDGDGWTDVGGDGGRGLPPSTPLTSPMSDGALDVMYSKK